MGSPARTPARPAGHARALRLVRASPDEAAAQLAALRARLAELDPESPLVAAAAAADGGSRRKAVPRRLEPGGDAREGEDDVVEVVEVAARARGRGGGAALRPRRLEFGDEAAVVEVAGADRARAPVTVEAREAPVVVLSPVQAKAKAPVVVLSPVQAEAKAPVVEALESPVEAEVQATTVVEALDSPLQAELRETAVVEASDSPVQVKVQAPAAVEAPDSPAQVVAEKAPANPRRRRRRLDFSDSESEDEGGGGRGGGGGGGGSGGGGCGGSGAGGSGGGSRGRGNGGGNSGGDEDTPAAVDAPPPWRYHRPLQPVRSASAAPPVDSDDEPIGRAAETRRRRAMLEAAAMQGVHAPPSPVAVAGAAERGGGGGAGRSAGSGDEDGGGEVNGADVGRRDVGARSRGRAAAGAAPRGRRLTLADLENSGDDSEADAEAAPQPHSQPRSPPQLQPRKRWRPGAVAAAAASRAAAAAAASAETERGWDTDWGSADDEPLVKRPRRVRASRGRGRREARRGGAARSTPPSRRLVAVGDSPPPRRRRRRSRRRVVSDDEGSASDDSWLVSDAEVFAGLEEEDEEEEVDLDLVAEEEAEMPLHPPEHLFVSPRFRRGRDRGRADAIKSNRDAFELYLEALLVTSLDGEFRLKLMSDRDVEDTEVTERLGGYRAAITRIEQDLMRAHAEYLADGRWRSLRTALDQRPFVTRLDELYILPQPVDLQKKIAFYCNGCNQRPGSKNYHDPTVTLVLHGPKCVDLAYRHYWPESIEDRATGDFHFPDDITSPTLEASALEKRFRVKRMKQWCNYNHRGVTLPREEIHRAKEEGKSLNDWRALGARAGADDDDDDDDDDGGDDSDSSGDGSNDEGSLLKDISGFGMECECAMRATHYHRAVWLRLEVTRQLRKMILLILREETIALEDDDCLDRMRDYLIADKDGNKGRYCVLGSLRSYTNDILARAEQLESRRRNLAAGGVIDDDDLIRDKRSRV